MTLYALIFYVLAALILVSSALAVTRRNLVHAVVYLVFSFFGSAMLFYLLGAPLLAALEVIIYAGAIMVLFLFIVMMLDIRNGEGRIFSAGRWKSAGAVVALYAAAGILAAVSMRKEAANLVPAVADPGKFGQYLFQRHWLAIEIVSLLLLVALVGALYLGKYRQDSFRAKAEDEP